MATIASAVISLSADTAQFQTAMERASSITGKFDNSVLTMKQQLREAGRIFDSTRTPQERFAMTTERLDGLLRNGVISTVTYARALAQAKDQMNGFDATSTKAANKLSGLSAETTKLGKGLLAIGAGVRFVNNFGNELERLRSEGFGNRDGFGQVAEISAAFAKSIPIIGELHGGIESLVDITASWITGTRTEAEELANVARIQDRRIAQAKAITDSLAELKKASTESSNAFLLGRSATDADAANQRLKFELRAIAAAFTEQRNALANSIPDADQLSAKLTELAAAETKAKLAAQDAALGLFAYERELRTIIDTAGLTAEQIKLKELRDRGAGAEAIAHTAAMQAEAEAAKRLTAAMDSARNLQKSWTETIKTFGLNSRDAAIKLLEIQEASQHSQALAAYIAQLKNLDTQLDRLEAHQKAMEDGKRIFEQTRTPAEKYAAEVERLNQLLKEAAISQDTFNRAQVQAHDELLRATKSEPAHLVERRFIAGFDPVKVNALNARDPISEVLKENREQRKIAEQHRDIDKETRDLVRQLTNIQPITLNF